MLKKTCLLFIIALILFSIFSTRIVFHDTPEYITVAKELAGFKIGKIDTTHSLMYPFIISRILKYSPSFTTIKLVNSFWFILSSLVFLSFLKNKKAFLIWAFSPLVWYTSIQISPIIPSSFFMLLTYATFKKWEEKKNKFYFIFSALSLGFASILYHPMLVVSLFFILIFFYNYKLKYFIFYLFFMLVTFSSNLLLDAYYFSLDLNGKILPFPFYSLVRYFGTNLMVSLGFNKGSYLFGPIVIPTFYFLIFISPLLFLIFKLNFSKYKKELIFLFLSVLFILIRVPSPIYYLPLAPIFIILLSCALKKRGILLHSVISAILIAIFTAPFFMEVDMQKFVTEDMEQIKKDFNYDEFLSSGFIELYWWDSSWPKFIDWQENNMAWENQDYFLKYNFETSSRMNDYKIIEFQANMKRTDGWQYKNLPWLVRKNKIDPALKILETHNLAKCYKELCVYEPKI